MGSKVIAHELPTISRVDEGTAVGCQLVETDPDLRDGRDSSGLDIEAVKAAYVAINTLEQNRLITGLPPRARYTIEISENSRSCPVASVRITRLRRKSRRRKNTIFPPSWDQSEVPVASPLSGLSREGSPATRPVRSSSFATYTSRPPTCRLKRMHLCR